MGITELMFSLYALYLNLKLRVLLTYYITKIIINGSPMAGHIHDTNIVIALDKQTEVVFISQCIAVGKLLETVASFL